MKRSVRRLILAAMLACMLCSAGCALLPAEEVLPDAPVVRRGDDSEFTLTYVQRGDLVKMQRYSVTYRAVRQERLCFAVDGLRMEEVDVQQGDSVKKGQVLMQLEQGELAHQLRSAQDACDTIALQLRQAEEKRELSRDEYALKLSYMDEEELEKAQTMEEFLRDQERAIQKLADQLELARAEAEQVEDALAERQLCAGIDGVATFVRAVQPGDLSSRTEIMVILADSESSMFVVETQVPENFYEGREVEVSINQVSYSCYVISAQEAGAAGENEVYLRCDLPTAELSDGDSGYLMLEVERYDDVLYVEKSAVKTMDGRQFVYVQGENGLRSTVEVTTGHAVSGYIEVLSGLEEGDAVILR